MKRVLFILALMSCLTTLVSAQTSQIATLLHDGNMSVYYGADALKNAHANAATGDVITLSSGQFNACDITKPLTIRGAGMGLTEVDYFVVPTVLTGDFKIAIPDDPDHYLILEGIQHNTSISLSQLYNAQFVKCVLGKINASISSFNLNFIHCDIRNSFCCNGNPRTSFNATNSHIKFDDIYSTYSNLTANYQNCFIETTQKLYNSLFNNCIIKGKGNLNGLGLMKGCSAFYCVWYGDGATQPFPNVTTNTRLDHENIFKENTFYELTDEIKALKSSDGTQIGIYGGNLPFDPTTTVPQISKFNVAPKTSADGKLSIDIEVEGIKQ